MTPHSPGTDQIDTLLWIGFVVAAIVVVAINVALLYAVRKYRSERGAEPRQVTGGRKLQLNFDVYNAMNGSYALWTNNNYGTNGATWQRPTSTFDGRLVKFGAQFDF